MKVISDTTWEGNPPEQNVRVGVDDFGVTISAGTPLVQVVVLSWAIVLEHCPTGEMVKAVRGKGEP